MATCLTMTTSNTWHICRLIAGGIYLSEEDIVTVGWVSLSRSGKSLSIKVLNQMFFVPLRDLYPVLDGRRERAEVKQWIEGEE